MGVVFTTTKSVTVAAGLWPRALELLDIRYSDPVVREWAVREIDTAMRDVELAEYLLQLVQVTWCCVVSDAGPTVDSGWHRGCALD